MNGSTSKTRTSFIARLVGTALVLSTVFIVSGASQAQALPIAETQVDDVIAYVNPLLSEYWTEIMAMNGETYQPAGEIVYFNELGDGETVATDGCGIASPGIGGAYCSADQNVYIDVAGVQELIDTQGAYAGGALFAHEIAHHLQNNVWDQTTLERQLPLSELHADCLTGIFSRWAFNNGHITWEDAVDGGDFAVWGGDSDAGGPSTVAWDHGTEVDRANAYNVGWFAATFDECRNVTATTTTGPVPASQLDFENEPSGVEDLFDTIGIIFEPTPNPEVVTYEDPFGPDGIDVVESPQAPQPESPQVIVYDDPFVPARSFG